MTDYAIGSKHWPGISKLTEECGELLQVLGKLIATNGNAEHWDGSNLNDRIEEELADVIAAIKFLVEANELNRFEIEKRAEGKLDLFHRWHREQRDEGDNE